MELNYTHQTKNKVNTSSKTEHTTRHRMSPTRQWIHQNKNLHTNPHKAPLKVSSAPKSFACNHLDTIHATPMIQSMSPVWSPANFANAPLISMLML